MDLAHVTALLLGVALAGSNVWQHLGRTPAARRWARPNGPWFRARSVLVVRPLLAAVLVLSGVSGPLTRGHWATIAVGLAAGTCLLVLLAFIILPIPIPAWTKPGWYRGYGDRRD